MLELLTYPAFFLAGCLFTWAWYTVIDSGRGEKVREDWPITKELKERFKPLL